MVTNVDHQNQLIMMILPNDSNRHIDTRLKQYLTTLDFFSFEGLDACDSL
jgi:hypothetical protein